MHLGDQGAGGIEGLQAAQGGILLDLLGHPVGTEHRDGSVGNLVDLFHEADAFGLQVFHYPAVVDDFVAHVDRRSVALQRRFDDLDCPFDPGTESARLS